MVYTHQHWFTYSKGRSADRLTGLREPLTTSESMRTAITTVRAR